MQTEILYQHFLSSTGVNTDSRHIENGNVFFALKGEKFDANLFAEQALQQGAAYVVVSELKNKERETLYPGRIFVVPDVLKTLQQLAGYHRKQLKCPVLAITGSNGKTTTKELIAAVLSKKYNTYATKGNLNNHIGIPLTLLRIKPEAQFAVIEMGANHQHEIASYCEYVQPDYGLITNVGYAHLEGFGGFEGVIKGKTELYAGLAQRNGKIFVNASNKILLAKISEFGFTSEDTNTIITYGEDNSAYCTGTVRATGEFLTIETEGEVISTQLVGNYNFENVMSAVCIGKYFGVDIVSIKNAIENYWPSNNRSQKIISGTNTIILDAYNANPSSMAEALNNFEKIDAENKVIIIGQMMELGQHSQAEHEKIAALVSGPAWEKVRKVFVGNGFNFLKDNAAVVWLSSTEEVKTWYREHALSGCFILIKGSRKNELEKILQD